MCLGCFAFVWGEDGDIGFAGVDELFDLGEDGAYQLLGNFFIGDALSGEFRVVRFSRCTVEEFYDISDLLDSASEAWISSVAIGRLG